MTDDDEPIGPSTYDSGRPPFAEPPRPEPPDIRLTRNPVEEGSPGAAALARRAAAPALVATVVAALLTAWWRRRRARHRG